MPRFAAIGLDHRHIYDLTQDLLDARCGVRRLQSGHHRSARIGGVSQAVPPCPGGGDRTSAG